MLILQRVFPDMNRSVKGMRPGSGDGAAISHSNFNSSNSALFEELTVVCGLKERN